MPRIVSMQVSDVRFPTSRQLDGSDAMNPAPDYSAAYVKLFADDGAEGHAFAFTIGRGNEVQVAAIRSFEAAVIGTEVAELMHDMGHFARRLGGDSQLRWLGPEKGAIHMALGAVVNAAWDLRAKVEGKPLWRLLSDLSPQQVVDLIDFRYIRDVLSEAEALSLLREAEGGKAERMANLVRQGLPAYTTTPGWLGYTDEKMVRLCNEAKTEGFDFVKLKVGADHDEDMRRCSLARETLGDSIRLAIDANQVWDVDEAIRRLRDFAKFDLVWVEEPTSPDDVLGHAKIRAEGGVPVATGEHVQNRIIFKQLMAAKAVDFVQIDATRVGGVNENIAIMLLAAKARLPICPHAGGVGLCEMVQHLSMFDYVALGGELEARVIEHVGHLHEHFTNPVQINGGRYSPPESPGFSTEMRAETLASHQFPDGPIWTQ